MGRKAEQLYQAGTAPPETLDIGEFVAQVVRPRGNSAYDVSVPASSVAMVRQQLRIPDQYGEETTLTLIVDMPPKFRNTLFVKRGGYVLVGLKEDVELVYPGAAGAAEAASEEPPAEAKEEVKEEEEDAQKADKKPAKNKKPRGKQPNPLKQQLKLHGTLKPQPAAGGAAPGTAGSGASSNKPKTHETTAVGEIIAVVMRGAREWHKRAWWPAEYVRGTQGWDESSDEDDDSDDNDVRGKLPPSDDEEDVEYY